jgi:hypothetical protein
MRSVFRHFLENLDKVDAREEVSPRVDSDDFCFLTINLDYCIWWRRGRGRWEGVGDCGIPETSRRAGPIAIPEEATCQPYPISLSVYLLFRFQLVLGGH